MVDKYGAEIEAIQFDGTNGAAIAAYVQSFVTANPNYFVSSYVSFNVASGVLTVVMSNSFDNMVFSNGDWLVRERTTLNAFPNNVFSIMYRSVASVLQTFVPLAIGIATVPSINAGQSANVAVTLKPSFADTSYTAAAVIIGSTTLLGQLNITGTVVTNASTVTVTVQNAALITVTGGKLLVTATHN